MKKLTGVLALSLSLFAGCRSAGDSSVRPDASSPPQTGTSQDALTGDAGASPTPSAPTALSDAERQAKEACLDQWLKARQLDPYGNADGTMYMGGTPLFNEATGETKDRLEFVYQKQPESKKACLEAGVAPPGK
ncbi:hypothetical protein POL68_05020 [Stigmatella sp. ncwal1]|uniref:Lipoprotein n=1 Tax=Stigmatella ashevillensis TaxID=2995309 RepID=A0ABT5D2D6_9BACT|nr:hypothetical protein [Stigmatella ashevillena]MDC0707824.1 hypothetical protein [Stigmatella ashevillena]